MKRLKGYIQYAQAGVETAILEGAGRGEGRLGGRVVLLVEGEDDLIADIGGLHRGACEDLRRVQLGCIRTTASGE